MSTLLQDEDKLEGGSSGTTLEEEHGLPYDAMGTAFANAVYARGISTNFGTMEPEEIQKFWNSKAVKYMGMSWDGEAANVSAFLADIGLTEGGSVTVPYMLSGNMVISEDPSVTYDSAESYNVDTDNGQYQIIIDKEEQTFYTTAWGHRTVFGAEVIYSVTVISPNLEEKVQSLRLINTNGTFFDFRFPDEDYAKVWSEYWFSIDNGALLLNGSFSVERRYTKNIGYGKPGYEILYDPGKDQYKHIVIDIPSVLASDKSIIFDWHSGGGGGGGDTTVLTLTVTAGISGRHADPMFATYNNRPIARAEKPSYGTGGYGGHGGGGGAGSATVVVRKFTTGKANSVDVRPIVKRHGYGGGGGKGGPGGDGCILVFW